MSAAEVPASGRLRPGTQLGKYEIQRFIAEGGMGELYVARATGIEGFQKTVALKRILSRFATREQHVRMFLDEAKVAATLHHPNIVSVFDIGDEAGVLFFSMEYVHGTDARALLEAARVRDQRVPLDAALEIAIGVTAGLHHAHQAGIVHRDVSPSNILLAHDGGVKVTDFGVAKVSERTTETRPGMLKGKVSYMSPEQCRDEALDRRSDIFAIGIVLYELTTGEKPFPGTSDFAIMEHIVRRDAALPSTIVADYPPELEAIVMRALSRDLDARHASAQDLQRDLRQLARDRKLDTSPLRLEAVLRDLFGAQVDTWRREEVEASRIIAPPTAVTMPEGAPPPKAEVTDASGEASAIVAAPPRRKWPLFAGLAALALGGAFAMRTLSSSGSTSSSAAPSTPSSTPIASPSSAPVPVAPPSTVGSSTVEAAESSAAPSTTSNAPVATNPPTTSAKTNAPVATNPPTTSAKSNVPVATNPPTTSAKSNANASKAPSNRAPSTLTKPSNAGSSTPTGPSASKAGVPGSSANASDQPSKTEPPKTEPPKTEPPKTEPPKTEPPKTEPPKTEPTTREVPWDPDSPTFPKSR
jgi:serine/threonine protein kinase